MTDSKARHFNSYEEFFVFYLQQHSDRMNRFLHACGTVLSIAFIIAMIATHHAWWAIAWPVIAYSFAWFGHFVVEGNTPATFGHPWWSFISDFRMVWLMVTGRLGSYLAKTSSESA